jgi:hypothetical protein
MRIAYVTLDDVNRFVVRRWTGGNNIRVECPAVTAPAAIIDTADAILLDLDHLPEPFRAAWLERVLTNGMAGRVLVHGHNITDAEAAALRRRGVRVCRGRLRRGLLDAWVVQELHRQQKARSASNGQPDPLLALRAQSEMNT